MANLQEGQKLWDIMGFATSNLGATFTGAPQQIEALKGATGGQFSYTPAPVTPAPITPTPTPPLPTPPAPAPTPPAPFIAPNAPPSVSTPQGGDLTEGQKLWDIMGIGATSPSLGAKFIGKPEQVEALKGATGGKFQFTPQTLVGVLEAPTAGLPVGMTQLTSPGQIPFFDIKGQVGITGQSGSYLYGTPKQEEKIITPEKLETKINLKLPEISGDLTDANNLVAGANVTVDQLIKQLTPTVQTETEKKQQAILDQMATQTEKLAQKAADQLTAEQATEIPELRKQFADINAQILTKIAEYNALMVKEEGKPITMNSIIGSQAQIQRVKASEIGLLQAQAQGLQGQIQTAQVTVNRSIDLKYSTIEAQINVYQAQLNAIQPKLNKEEKKLALAQQLILDNYKQKIENQKTEEANIQKIMLEAIKSGITDTNVLAQISASSTYLGALKILGENMPETNIINLQTKYPDAGILLTDNLVTAQSKLKGSKIYQQQTRLVGGGGGASTPSSSGYKLVESEAQKEIDNILSGQSNWSASWNRLKQFAVKNNVSLSNEEINILLGGEIPYNPQTQEFDVQKATGLASAEEVKKRQQAKFKQTQTSHGTIIKETDKYIQYSDGVEYK